MIRKQIYIAAHQERLLKERAKRYRLSEAELIRQSLDRGLASQPSRGTDHAAWQQIERFIKRRMRKRVRQRSRRWRREDLYDR